MQRPCCPRAPTQHNSSRGSSKSNSISSSRTTRHISSSIHAASTKRILTCYASAAGGDPPLGMAAAPELSALNRLDLSSAMLLANLMQPPGQQQVRVMREILLVFDCLEVDKRADRFHGCIVVAVRVVSGSKCPQPGANSTQQAGLGLLLHAQMRFTVLV
jgi:hypothetical protein